MLYTSCQAQELEWDLQEKKFCFGHFPVDLFLLLFSGATKSTWVHQEQLYQGTSGLLGQTWSFLLQGLELGASLTIAITICQCFSVLQVDRC